MLIKMELHEMKQTFYHFWRCNHVRHLFAACDCNVLLRPDADHCTWALMHKRFVSCDSIVNDAEGHHWQAW